MAIYINGKRGDRIQVDSALADSNNPVKNSVINTHLTNNASLATTDKSIVGAINELNTKKIGRFETMPTASATYADRQCYQYIGTNTTDYTHGHFYECVESTTTAGTYLWQEVELGGSVAFADITGSPNDNANLASALNQRQLVTNLVTAFQATPDDVHYPSEKLVYDAIENLKQTIYDYAHPVGSTIIGFSAPTVPTGVTATWSVSSAYDGNALWVDSSKTAGTELEGSLPNIQGYLNSPYIVASKTTGYNGAISAYQTVITGYYPTQGATTDYGTGIKLNASNSNAVYSASAGTNVVRPTSTVVHVYVRTA